MKDLVLHLLSDIDACHDTTSDDMGDDVDAIFVCGFVTLSVINQLSALIGIESMKKGK